MQNKKKASVLVLADYYLPGWKAGGPVKSLSSLVDALGDSFCFQIITRDRDFGDSDPYSGVATMKWCSVGKARVLYLPPKLQSLRGIRGLLADVSYDTIYMNSLFSPPFSLKPLLLRRCGLVPNRPAIVAPRGQLNGSALRTKSYKKGPVLGLARAFGCFSGIHWHAANSYEASEIALRVGGRRGSGIPSVHISPNVMTFRDYSRTNCTKRKEIGEVRIVFLSRVCRIKNLLFALTLLSDVKARVVFDIYGPLEDPNYWAECRRVMESLPPNISVAYRGVVEPENVRMVLSSYDVFLLPTLGESFCHAILEALLSGAILLISDQTPWVGLQKHKAGWDLPLDKPDGFRRAIESVAKLDKFTRDDMASSAKEYGQRIVEANNRMAIAAHEEMFLAVMDQ